MLAAYPAFSLLQQVILTHVEQAVISAEPTVTWDSWQQTMSPVWPGGWSTVGKYSMVLKKGLNELVL